MKSLVKTSVVLGVLFVSAPVWASSKVIVMERGQRTKVKIQFHQMIEDGRSARSIKTESLDQTLKEISGSTASAGSREYVDFIRGEMVETDEIAKVSEGKPKSKDIKDLVREL